MAKDKLRKVVVPGHIEEIESFTFNSSDIGEVVLSEGVKKICENAFKNCENLQRVYIPKSVLEIEKNAFIDCKNLKIFCEGEPKPGWVETTRIEEREESYISPEDDAFNFHRSSGGWSYSTYARKVEVKESWNPCGYNVYTSCSEKEDDQCQM